MDKAKIRSKLSNFWYYYKVYILIGIAAIVSVAYFVATAGPGRKPDMTVLVVTEKTEPPQNVLDQLSGALQRYVRDVNGDGAKQVQYLFIDLNKKQDAESQNAAGARLMAEFSGGSSMLCVTDEAAFDEVNKDGVFDTMNQYRAGAGKRIPLSQITPLKETGAAKISLGISIRKFGGTGNANRRTAHEEATHVLKQILAK